MHTLTLHFVRSSLEQHPDCPEIPSNTSKVFYKSVRSIAVFLLQLPLSLTNFVRLFMSGLNSLSESSDRVYIINQSEESSVSVSLHVLSLFYPDIRLSVCQNIKFVNKLKNHMFITYKYLRFAPLCKTLVDV